MGFFKLTIRDVPLHDKTVLVRADYNVPLSDEGAIDDDLRIRASLPTLRYLLERNCKVIVMSHLGRPEGRDPKLSLQPIAQRLGELLDQDVRFINDCKGDSIVYIEMIYILRNKCDLINRTMFANYVLIRSMKQINTFFHLL